MQIEAIGILAVVLGFLGWFAGPAYTIHVFIASTLLGSSAAIILTVIGYANVQPAHLLLGFIIIAAIARRKFASVALRSLTFPNEGFWLLLMAVYAVISAILLPRLLAGTTYVFAIARTEIGAGIISMPLAPTSGNITQTVYLIGDVACFFVFYMFAGELEGFRAIVRAILVCTALNLLLAAFDVGGWLLHTGDLLSFLRNGSYRMLDQAEIAGFKRIVGPFPEASTFAYFTLGWFAFCLRLWLAGIHTRASGPLAFLSLLALLFATSSTGYAGMAGVVALLFAISLAQIVTRPVSRQTLAFAALAPVIGSVLLVGLYLHQPSWQRIQTLVDGSIFNKLSSDSGIERATWNEQALTNVSDTNGLGAGVGSVRASSFPIAVLGNTGIIGAVAYGGFLLSVLFRRKHRWSSPYPAACQSAARWACLAQLLGASVSGSFLDLALPFFVFAGLACAGPEDRRPRRVPSRILRPANALSTE